MCAKVTIPLQPPQTLKTVYTFMLEWTKKDVFTRTGRRTAAQNLERIEMFFERHSHLELLTVTTLEISQNHLKRHLNAT